MSFLLAVAMALPLTAEPARDSVGVVSELKGHVFWRANAKAPEKPLTDGHKTLYEDEVLRCGQDGFVKIELINGTVTVLKPMQQSTMTWPPRKAPTELEAKAREAIRNYSRAGASERGEDDGILLAPASGSAIIPTTFVIRWVPAEGPVSFRLRADDRTIWHETVEDGSRGVLESAAARKAIVDSGATSLKLVASSAAGKGEMLFSILSPAEQTELDREMKFWDSQESSFLRHIGRASAFANRRLFAEAANEYETALHESPDSPDLISATLRAEKRAGNAARVTQLQSHLPSDAPKP
jgi:hypothetical protein